MFKSFWNQRPQLRGLTIPIFIILFAMLSAVAHGQTPTTSTTTIKVDLACFVASQYVHKYYPGFKWLNVDHMVIHDIEGSVVAYAFIYSKSTSPLRSATDLQSHITQKSMKLRQITEENTDDALTDDQKKQRIHAMEKEVYNFNDMATVITGATSNSKLIQRHFRGLPEFWVGAQSLDEAYSTKRYDKDLQVSHVIMITPMDFRIVAIESAAKARATGDLRSTAKARIPDSAYCLNLRDNNAVEISTVRKKRRSIANRKQQRLNALEPEDRKKYEQALRDRAQAQAAKWQKYHELRPKAQKEETAQ